MIISVDELKILFKQYGIKTDLTDDELKVLIKLQLESILAELNITLDPMPHNYTTYHHNPKKPIVLPLRHIQGIDTIIVNGKKLCHHDFYYDELNGIVHLKKHCGCCPLKVFIKYYTSLPPLFLEKLKSLLLDKMLLLMSPDDDRDIKRITEGDVTVEYMNDWDWYDNLAKGIPLKIEELENMLLPETAYMI